MVRDQPILHPTVAPHLPAPVKTGDAGPRYSSNTAAPQGSGTPCQARGDGERGGWVRRLAREPGRDTKSVHREVAMLTATGLIERRAADEVAVGWDRAATELDLASSGVLSG